MSDFELFGEIKEEQEETEILSELPKVGENKDNIINSTIENDRKIKTRPQSVADLGMVVNKVNVISIETGQIVVRSEKFDIERIFDEPFNAEKIGKTIIELSTQMTVDEKIKIFKNYIDGGSIRCTQEERFIKNAIDRTMLMIKNKEI